MVDNKVNMSLDDIIKKERSDRSRQTGMARGGLRGKRGNFAGARRGFRGGMRSMPVRGTRVNVMRQRQQTRGGRGNFRQRQSNMNVAGGSRPLNSAATTRLVNKLVKRAINQQTNQSLIQRTALVGRRRAAAVATARVPVTFARRGIRGGLSGRLRGVSQRSRVIGGNAARRARAQLQQQRQLLIATSPRNVRGRGVTRMGRLVSDEVPVIYESELARPRAPRMAVVRRARQQARMRLGQQAQEMVLEQGPSRRQLVVRRARSVPMNRQRYVGGQNAQRVIVVSDEPYGRRVQQPRYQQVVEVAEPRVRFVDPPQTAQSSRRNAQMRAALGIGRMMGNRRSAPGRFEASESFLQRVPARRGRGFKNTKYVY